MRLRFVDQVAQRSLPVIATVLRGDVAQPPSAVIGSLLTRESASVAEPAPDGN
jgi:hypothetical protein